MLDRCCQARMELELMKAMFDRIDVPVIFLSAYGRDHIIARAFEAGAVDYIVKPFSPTELVARIKQPCEGGTRLTGPSRRSPTCWVI